jgi:RNA polymerase sigma-70 factor, ECF subfamily
MAKTWSPDELRQTMYGELRRVARRYLGRERKNHTLQPTALVHEAYLRLVDQDKAGWPHRRQFFAIAAMMMRRILIDRARARKMAKRSGNWTRVSLSDDVAHAQPRDVDVLDLDKALSELATFDERKSRVAELRYFTGLSLEEIGAVLDLSVATVEREWQAGRAWLHARLTGGAPRR